MVDLKQLLNGGFYNSLVAVKKKLLNGGLIAVKRQVI